MDAQPQDQLAYVRNGCYVSCYGYSSDRRNDGSQETASPEAEPFLSGLRATIHAQAKGREVLLERLQAKGVEVGQRKGGNR